MNVQEINRVIADIASLAEDDPETAHAREDVLFANVLKAIANGAPNAQALALAALKSQEIEFPRWCA